MQLLGASTFHHSPLLIHYIGESRRIKLSFREIKSESETVMKSIETSWNVMSHEPDFLILQGVQRRRPPRLALSGYAVRSSSGPMLPLGGILQHGARNNKVAWHIYIYTAMNFYVGWFETFILNSSHVLHYTNCILPLAYFFAWSRANGMLWCKLG